MTWGCVMRELLLRGAAAIISLGAVAAAVLWPDSSKCVANCQASAPSFFGPPVFAVDHHIALRLLLACGGLALGGGLGLSHFPSRRADVWRVMIGVICPG
jgi:hypothetical protein